MPTGIKIFQECFSLFYNPVTDFYAIVESDYFVGRKNKMNHIMKKTILYVLIASISLFLLIRIEGILIYLTQFYDKLVHNYVHPWMATDTLILQNRIIILFIVYFIYRSFFSKNKK